MFLKSLTIKGFKSFAEAANLAMEPGITVVVGPNGSGKSNVVDAMAWVLGAQAPKSVRSQKMDDVIFAGTTSKKALGRAEVSITIDNEDGQLPIEFSEVTLTRTLFRSGDSDYAINGVSCRLLDIQELLSDSGVGRQQHIIISQGQIDEVLNSKPEDRRSIIEEAAGVLKYRRRKERAEKRLVSTEENMHRLSDLLREVRRQVKPLEKQANAARRHTSLIEELAAFKAFLAGRQLRALTEAVSTNKRSIIEAEETERDLISSLARLDATVLEYEAELVALGASDVGDVRSRGRSISERIKGQNNVLTERRRRLQSELQSAIDDGLVANLEAEAAKIERDLTDTDKQEGRLVPERKEIESLESSLQAEQLSFDSEWGDGLAPKPTKAPEMRAQLKALDKAATRTASELEKVQRRLASFDQRHAGALNEQETATAALDHLAGAIPTLESTLATAEKGQIDAESEAVTITEERRNADAEANRWEARADALRQALDEARSKAGADALANTSGVLGVLLDLVAIDTGWESAVEAAVGEALAAVVVDSPVNAASALASLEAKELVVSVLALGRAVASGTAGDDMADGDGSGLREKVRALRPDVEPLLDLLLARSVVAEGGWRQALELAQQSPDLVVVTRSGDRFGPSGWKVGLSGTGATGAALEEAEASATFARAIADEAAEKFRTLSASAKAAVVAAKDADRKLRSAVHEKELATKSRQKAADSLAQFADDHSLLTAQQTELETQLTADRAAADLVRRALPAVENEEAEYNQRVEALTRSRTTLEERTRSLSAAKNQIDVRAAAIEQRRELLNQRLADTESRLERLAVQREEARARRTGLEESLAEVDGLARRLAEKASILQKWLAALDAEQKLQSEAARKVSDELGARRSERQGAERRLNETRERKGRLELDQAEKRVKLETISEAVRRELDMEPAQAMEALLPEVEGGGSPEAKVRELERELKLLGPINPLALEEFEALKERHEFLASQLDDVKTTRRDLNTLVRSIDAEIVTVFSSAFADVSTNFVDLFTTLFPGGKGGVMLTNADDLLNCGIEIEAKPSGKNVKKLSLLSGGERSLVALAFLFAVFRSRPSPFYVMDEVEAALDDVNLSRFLALLEEFRKEAQLIVVSHQKRTMEAADVLYGVTMKPGGSSKVIREKVDDRHVGVVPPGSAA